MLPCRPQSLAAAAPRLDAVRAYAPEPDRHRTGTDVCEKPSEAYRREDRENMGVDKNKRNRLVLAVLAIVVLTLGGIAAAWLTDSDEPTVQPPAQPPAGVSTAPPAPAEPVAPSSSTPPSAGSGYTVPGRP